MYSLLLTKLMILRRPNVKLTKILVLPVLPGNTVLSYEELSSNVDTNLWCIDTPPPTCRVAAKINEWDVSFIYDDSNSMIVLSFSQQPTCSPIQWVYIHTIFFSGVSPESRITTKTTNCKCAREGYVCRVACRYQANVLRCVGHLAAVSVPTSVCRQTYEAVCIWYGV